jgi:hypothetical protein
MLFDGFYWNAMIQVINPYFSNDSNTTAYYHIDVWQHVNNTSLASGWSNIRIPGEDFLTYKYAQGTLVGRQLGPMASTIISNSPQPSSVLTSIVGKAVFTDPRV